MLISPLHRLALQGALVNTQANAVGQQSATNGNLEARARDVMSSQGRDPESVASDCPSCNAIYGRREMLAGGVVCSHAGCTRGARASTPAALWSDARFAEVMHNGMRDYERRMAGVKETLFGSVPLAGKEVCTWGGGRGGGGEGAWGALGRTLGVIHMHATHRGPKGHGEQPTHCTRPTTPAPVGHNRHRRRNRLPLRTNHKKEYVP